MVLYPPFSQGGFKDAPEIAFKMRILNRKQQQARPGRRPASPGWRRKGSLPVGASQQLFCLTFKPWSKRPSLCGANIKWWTFSSLRCPLFFLPTRQQDLSCPSLMVIDARLDGYEMASCCRAAEPFGAHSFFFFEENQNTTGETA